MYNDKPINNNFYTYFKINFKMKRKILSIWIGLCYISLTILLGACDEACCCPTPTSGLGTIFIFPDFASNSLDCESPFTMITPPSTPNSVINFNDSENAPCSESAVWFATVRVAGTEGNDQCVWHKVYHFPQELTPVMLNGRIALKITGVPLRNNDLAVSVIVGEPKHNSGPSGCTSCTGKYSVTWEGVVATPTIANQQIFIPCTGVVPI